MTICTCIFGVDFQSIVQLHFIGRPLEVIPVSAIIHFQLEVDFPRYDQHLSFVAFLHYFLHLYFFIGWIFRILFCTSARMAVGCCVAVMH